MRPRLLHFAVVCAVLASASPALAQTPAPPPPAPEAPRTLLSGYMEAHYNKPQFQDGVLDFHRFVLLFTHRYSDRIRFVGELELEHALVEGLAEAGELELEQAYIDFLLTRSFNVRAGMMLIPVGIMNELHEPPVFYGVERPLLDTVILPTTWFEVGAGVHGEIGSGWRYRAFVTTPLNAARFNAEDGLRDGRQKGSRANAGRVVLPSFTLVNLAASYDIDDHVEIYGRVENLLAEDYYEVFAFPTDGRAAYVGARVKF